MNARMAGDAPDGGFGPVEFRIDRSVPGVFVARVSGRGGDAEPLQDGDIEATGEPLAGAKGRQDGADLGGHQTRQGEEKIVAGRGHLSISPRLSTTSASMASRSSLESPR